MMIKLVNKNYLGAMILGLLVIAACDNMTGSTDLAEDKVLTKAVDLTGNTVGETTTGVAGVFIDPITDLELSAAQLSTGYDVYVTGYVGYKSAGTGNKNPRLTELHLEVNKDEEGWSTINMWDDSNLESQPLTGRSNKPGREFDDYDEFGTDFNKWTINAIGSYDIRATAKFTGPFDEAVDTEDVVVTLETSFEVEFPAAPAIAARILKANNVDARYGNRRSGGNYISDVAKHMGPGTDFDGETKADGDDMNQAYWDAVWNYLKVDKGLTLPNPPEGYIWPVL